MKRFLLFLLIFLAGFGIASFYYVNVYPTRIAGVTQQVQNLPVVNEESAITAAVKNTLPSVVTIGIDTSTSSGQGFQINPLNPFVPIPGSPQEVKQNIASGFLVSNDGLIITNKHVVSDTSASYDVITNDGKKYNVVNIYRDPLNDIAILKINPSVGSSFKPVLLGNSSQLTLGQRAIAIGTPLGEFQNTVTTGVVSGLGRGITAGSPVEGYVEKLDNVIQTDAPINPGNSGGPLLNLKGEVIGINTAVSSEGQNLGFAIPVNVVKETLQNFKNNGFSFKQPFLGVHYRMVTKDEADSTGTHEGALVVDVVSNSPAQKGGVKNNDILTEFAGAKITGDNSDQIANLVLQKKVGEKVPITVWRNGKMVDLKVVMDAAS